MLDPSQQKALLILQTRIWRDIGGLTRFSEKKRLDTFEAILLKADANYIVGPLAAILAYGPKNLADRFQTLFMVKVAELASTSWHSVDKDIRLNLSTAEHQLHRTGRSPQPIIPNDLTSIHIAMSHPSGYQRYDAILEISNTSFSQFSGQLLMRCNDWVQNVSELAKSIFLKMIRLNDTIEWENLAVQLHQLSLQSRHDHKEFLKSTYDTIIKSNKLDDILLYFRKTHSYQAKQFISGLLLNSGTKISHSNFEIIFIAGTDPQKLRAIDIYESIFPNKKIEKLLLKLISVKWSPLRRKAIRKLITEYGHTDLAIASLTDSSYSIREMARFYLPSMNQEALIAHYQELLKNKLSPLNFRSALEGLREVSKVDAHKIALNYLDDNLSQSKKKTCISCLNLSCHKIEQRRLIDWLCSSKIAISHSSFKTIIRDQVVLDTNILQDILSSKNAPEHSKDFSYSILNRGTKWQKLLVQLKYIQHPAIKISQHAATDLGKWTNDFGLSFLAPSFKEISEIETLLNQNKKYIDPYFHRNLTFILNSFK